MSLSRNVRFRSSLLGNQLALPFRTAGDAGHIFGYV